MPRYADTSACTPEENDLWERLRACQDRVFYTAKGLDFTCSVRGNELFVSRKEKSITRSTVNQALRVAMERDGVVPGPKTLGTFGASYLYPIFCAFDIIDRERSQAAPRNRKKSRSRSEL